MPISASPKFPKPLERWQRREIRLAFLLKRADGLAHVGVAPDRALQPAHVAQAVFGAVVAGVVQHLLGAPDGHGRFAGDFFGGLQGGGHGGFVGGQHLVHQAVGQRLVGTQAAAGVGQLFHHRHRYELGQSL